MSNFLLFNDSLNVPAENFDSGIASLIEVRQSSRENDVFVKDESVWLCPTVMQLFGRSDFAAKAAMQFIGQITSINQIIQTKNQLDQHYARACNAFLGIDFSACTIPNFCQVHDLKTYHAFCRNCFSNFSANSIEELEDMYSYLFPRYIFKKKAFEDMLFWIENDFENYAKALALLEDIPRNPFTGGLGQTEVLKHTDLSLASKRINRPDRVIYSLEQQQITVYRCREHYI